MKITKKIIVLLLCSLSGYLCKPVTESDLTTGRGVGSTVWGWLTYPFTWWRSEPELPPLSEKLKSPPPGPYDSYEISRHNVTIYCNDQTCTTMKCGSLGCRNITCNMYDTDFTGECREKDIMPILEANLPANILQPLKNIGWPTHAPGTNSTPSVTTTQKYTPAVEEHPLELEAILSSTVKDKEETAPKENKGKVSESFTKQVPPIPTTPRQA